MLENNFTAKCTRLDDVPNPGRFGYKIKLLGAIGANISAN